MLSQRYRFHSRGGVNFTHRQGKKIRGDLISLVYAANTRGRQRFAVIVSKKVEKSAVGRNRIRRRVYEAIRLELPNIKQPADCLFQIHSREVIRLDFSELQATIQSLLKAAHII